jgi:hypothetical protein
MSCSGRVLSLSLEFELFSAFSLVCLFLCHLLVLWFLLLLDDLLKLFLAFGLLAMLYVSWIYFTPWICFAQAYFCFSVLVSRCVVCFST